MLTGIDPAKMLFSNLLGVAMFIVLATCLQPFIVYGAEGLGPVPGLAIASLVIFLDVGLVALVLAGRSALAQQPTWVVIVTLIILWMLSLSGFGSFARRAIFTRA